MSICFNHTDRKDMIPPCKECPDREPGCGKDCQRPEYLTAMELQRKAKEVKAKADAVRQYEYAARGRRRGK